MYKVGDPKSSNGVYFYWIKKERSEKDLPPFVQESMSPNSLTLLLICVRLNYDEFPHNECTKTLRGSMMPILALHKSNDELRNAIDGQNNRNKKLIAEPTKDLTKRVTFSAAVRTVFIRFFL